MRTKKLKILLLLLMYIDGIEIWSQSNGCNYVMSYTLLDSLKFEDIYDLGGLDKVNTIKEVNYYDGLGRNVQTVRDIADKVTMKSFAYDCNGRVSDSWAELPSNKNYPYIQPNMLNSISESFYNDPWGFTTTDYDALGRSVRIKGSGSAWRNNGKEQTILYDTNTDREVKWYKAPIEKVSLVDSGYYPAATLTCQKTIDEDGKALAVYTDFMGNKVLERRSDNNDTYFVYDDIGRLRYVLTPEYQKSGYKNLYAYEYRYDVKGRIVKKILPGCEYIQYWYDNADRIAFMQDATLREHGLYRFFFYDQFNRLALQGVCRECNRNGEVCKCSYRKHGEGYLNTGYELSIPDKITDANIEMVNYYDNYDFIRLTSREFRNIKDSLYICDHSCSTGFKTGSIIYTSNNIPVVETFYYDIRGRNTATRRLWNLGRLSVIDNSYTFTGLLQKKTTAEYKQSSESIECTNRNVLEYIYDKTNSALLGIDFTVYDIDNIPHRQRVMSYIYNGIGKTKSTVRGGKVGPVDYDYNVRGWTTNIKSQSFTEEIHYTDGLGTPFYNGNISSQVWNTPDYEQSRGYKFEYDSLDRLKEAIYGEGNSLDDKQNRYNEKVIEYTANGAMKHFQRRGKKDNGEYGKIDNLNIKLNGNQLLNVTDDALPANKYSSFNFIDGANENTEYEYNGNGALVKDLNRGIQNIEYDLSGNPINIDFSNKKYIQYSYTPDGRKISKAHVWASPILGTISLNEDIESEEEISITSRMHCISYEYGENTVYRNNKVYYIIFPGGFCTMEEGKPVFHYYTQDHLGNNRNVVNEDGTIEQATHYYPFGGTFNDIGIDSEFQQYKYNGKELDRMYGLDTYDYGARQYFSVLPIWDRIDPRCEEDYHISPYAYCRNNPIKFIDNKGKKVRIPYQNQQLRLLSYINKYTTQNIGINNDGFLYIQYPTIYNNTGSKIFTNNLIKAFDNESLTINIFLITNYIETDIGKVYLSERGEGITYRQDEQTVNVVISDRQHFVKNKNHTTLWQMPEDILMHELIGHAIPKIIKTDYNTGDAIENENIIRRELKKEERNDEGKDYE